MAEIHYVELKLDQVRACSSALYRNALPSPLDPLVGEIKDHVTAGHKIYAIKALKTHFFTLFPGLTPAPCNGKPVLGLEAAKNVVDDLSYLMGYQEHRPSEQDCIPTTPKVSANELDEMQRQWAAYYRSTGPWPCVACQTPTQEIMGIWRSEVDNDLLWKEPEKPQPTQHLDASKLKRLSRNEVRAEVEAQTGIKAPEESPWREFARIKGFLPICLDTCWAGAYDKAMAHVPSDYDGWDISNSVVNALVFAQVTGRLDK